MISFVGKGNCIVTTDKIHEPYPVDLEQIPSDDYGVHVQYLGNTLEVLILGPTFTDRFSMSCPDALDLRDAITTWARSIGAE
jgi:hypothetical protein